MDTRQERLSRLDNANYEQATNLQFGRCTLLFPNRLKRTIYDRRSRAGNLQTRKLYFYP